MLFLLIYWGRVSQPKTELATLASFFFFSSLLCLCLSRLGLQAGLHAHLAFMWVGSEDPNFGPHIGKVNTLTTEPYSQLKNYL